MFLLWNTFLSPSLFRLKPSAICLRFPPVYIFSFLLFIFFHTSIFDLPLLFLLLLLNSISEKVLVSFLEKSLRFTEFIKRKCFTFNGPVSFILRFFMLNGYSGSQSFLVNVCICICNYILHTKHERILRK